MKQKNYKIYLKELKKINKTIEPIIKKSIFDILKTRLKKFFHRLQ